MDGSERPRLTFAQMEAWIEALPVGPVAALGTPRWIVRCNLVGMAGMALALSPSMLIQWLQPQLWMLWMARMGLATMIAGLLPGFVRNVRVLLQEFRHHRRGLIEQFDHDVDQFRALVARLAAYPCEVLDERMRYARMGHERLASRLSMMVGGVERLGLLPVLLSLFVVLRNWRDLLGLPFWLALLAAMAAGLWLIGWAGAEFRRRLQLYEFLLGEASRSARSGNAPADARRGDAASA